MVFLPGLWDKALPAAILLSFPVLLSLRTLEAEVAALALVTLDLAIGNNAPFFAVFTLLAQSMNVLYNIWCMEDK